MKLYEFTVFNASFDAYVNLQLNLGFEFFAFSDSICALSSPFVSFFGSGEVGFGVGSFMSGLGGLEIENTESDERRRSRRDTKI